MQDPALAQALRAAVVAQDFASTREFFGEAIGAPEATEPGGRAEAPFDREPAYARAP